MVKEYMVIESWNISGLEKEVNKYIQKEWIPLGGVSVSSMSQKHGNIGHTYCQAMLKNISKS